MIAGIVYILCALTACACAFLLLSAHRRTGNRLLLWSGLCFVGLTLNNALVFLDVMVIHDLDLFSLRNAASLIAMGLLLFGLVWEEG